MKTQLESFIKNLSAELETADLSAEDIQVPVSQIKTRISENDGDE